MPRVQSPQNTRVTSDNGVRALLFQAGEVRTVPQHLLANCIAKGCIELQDGQEPFDFNPRFEQPPTQAAGKSNETDKVNDKVVEQIADAVKLIFQTGDTGQLTVAGDPKVKAIEALLGHTISRAERELGLALFREQEEG